jgi:uncharacterized protein (DUF849 family)
MSDEPITTEAQDLSELMHNADLSLLAGVAQDLVQTRLTVDKIFAQTTWLCQMVGAIQATLPPPMQAAVSQAFTQIGANNGG